jgi:hypothetical protein
VSGSNLELLITFFFSSWHLWVFYCWSLSLTRGCVCNLLVRLLLSFARAVTLGPESRRTHETPTWRARSPYPPETEWPGCNPGHWVSKLQFWGDILMLPLGRLQVKHAVQHGIWVPTQHLLRGTRENHRKLWSSWLVAVPSECKLTSNQQSGIKYASLTLVPICNAFFFENYFYKTFYAYVILISANNVSPRSNVHTFILNKIIVAYSLKNTIMQQYCSNNSVQIIPLFILCVH